MVPSLLLLRLALVFLHFYSSLGRRGRGRGRRKAAEEGEEEAAPAAAPAYDYGNAYGYAAAAPAAPAQTDFEYVFEYDLNVVSSTSKVFVVNDCLLMKKHLILFATFVGEKEGIAEWCSSS